MVGGVGKGDRITPSVGDELGVKVLTWVWFGNGIGIHSLVED